MIESTKHAYKYGFTVSPNPFSKLTNISFEKAYGARDIELKIYDVAGKLVSEFSHLASQQINHVTWNGTDNTGNKVSAGIYFVQLEIDKENLIEKVLLLK
jgi:flagellar hook assembly protein FlgD